MGVLRALRIAPPPQPPNRSEHPSYILNVLASEFDPNPGSRGLCRVLDLGTSVRENFEFYSTFAAHIHIEDLSSNLIEHGDQAAHGEQAIVTAETSCFGAMPHLNEADGLDLIMCWDLFNYCTREQAMQLGEALVKLAKPGTRLFALIGTHPRIPARPRIFKITDRLRLAYETTTAETAVCPRFTKTEIDRFLPGFTRIRSFLLRNGMEEQLFVFE